LTADGRGLADFEGVDVILSHFGCGNSRVTFFNEIVEVTVGAFDDRAFVIGLPVWSTFLFMIAFFISVSFGSLRP